MVNASLMDQAQQLDGAEKLELIYALWDSIDHAERNASEHAVELVRSRTAAADANPNDEISSAQFWVNIARRTA